MVQHAGVTIRQHGRARRAVGQRFEFVGRETVEEVECVGSGDPKPSIVAAVSETGVFVERGEGCGVSAHAVSITGQSKWGRG